MDYWEHLHITLEHVGELGYAIRREDGFLKGLDVDSYIHRLGAEGWQMVGVVFWPGGGSLPDQMLWFKRGRVDTTSEDLPPKNDAEWYVADDS